MTWSKSTMPSWGSSHPSIHSLPDHCTPENYFLTYLSTNLHTCIPTPLAFLSTVLGILSIVSWLFAQLPQIYKNYTVQSTSSLSMYFVVEWCLGDTTNLVGALFTQQATWQVVVAAYYVSVDLALVVQFFWYTHYKPWRKEQETKNGVCENERDDGSESSTINEGSGSEGSSDRSSSSTDGKDDDRKPPTKPLAVPFSNFHFPTISTPREKGSPTSSHPTIHRLQHSTPSLAPSPKTLLLVSMLCAVLSTASPLQPLLNPFVPSLTTSRHSESNREFLGRLLSWTSTLLYLGSRLPQLYKNHVRRSTAGLAASLFIAAFFGNLFYASSILTNPRAWSSYPPYGLHGWVGPDGSNKETWIKLAAPFWLGAAGVLALDAAIGAQFLAFGEKEVVVKVVERDRRGRKRNRWRKVSGWMRGWVPSGSPARMGGKAVTVGGEERRGLLSEEARVGGTEGRSYGSA